MALAEKRREYAQTLVAQTQGRMSDGSPSGTKQGKHAQQRPARGGAGSRAEGMSAGKQSILVEKKADGEWRGQQIEGGLFPCRLCAAWRCIGAGIIACRTIPFPWPHPAPSRPGYRMRQRRFWGLHQGSASTAVNRGACRARCREEREAHHATRCAWRASGDAATAELALQLKAHQFLGAALAPATPAAPCLPPARLPAPEQRGGRAERCGMK